MPEVGVVKYGFGAAEVIALTATGAQAVTVINDLTVLDGQTVQATAARTINVTLGDDLNIGARIIVVSKTAATETTVFGTGITGATITGVTGKTFVTEFVYNGTAFLNTGTPVQID